MTSKTLGNLTDATALTGTEQVYVVQSSNSRKSTAQAIADLGTSQDNMTDGTTNKNYTATEQIKLAGIATGATANTGTVTSAALSVPTGLSVSGSPITTSGTFAITYASGYEGFTTALKTLVNSAVQPADVRELLTANRTYYVATTGSDSNDGLTAGTAFLTIQRAVNIAVSLDLSIWSVSISVAAGTYSEAVNLKSFVGGSGITIIGDTTTPANVVIAGGAACFTAASVIGPWTVRGMKMAPSAGNCIAASNGSVINYGNVDFGAGTGTQSHIGCSGGAVVTAIGNYTISGGCFRHWWVESGGYVLCAGKTITLTGTPAFSNAFAYADMLAIIQCNANTFTGSATGKRYTVTLNSVIQSSGATLPGDTAGATATGGQYA